MPTYTDMWLDEPVEVCILLGFSIETFLHVSPQVYLPISECVCLSAYT